MKKTGLLFISLFLVLGLSAQNWDIDLLREINLNRNTQLDNTFIGITNSAAPVSYGMPVVLLGTGLLTKDSLMVQKSIYIGASLLVSTIITTGMKYTINRPRPFITYPELQVLSDGGSPSFPSGHTSDAFALATSLSLSCPKWYIIAPAYLWAGAVGYSRMDLGVHYPSDVLVGALVGAGSAYLCYQLQKWFFKKDRTFSKRTN